MLERVISCTSFFPLLQETSTDPPPDPDRLRLAVSPTGRVRPSTRRPRHRQGERFLKGPIPWPRLDRAGRLRGKALAVALVLWQKAGATGRRTVPFNQAGAAELGLGPESARRGVRRLESAGLVSGRRRPGRGLDVTLLAADEPAGIKAGRHGGPGGRERITPGAGVPALLPSREPATARSLAQARNVRAVRSKIDPLRNSRQFRPLSRWDQVMTCGGYHPRREDIGLG